MGFLKKIGKGLKKAVKAVGKAVKTVTAKVVKPGLNLVGKLIQDAPVPGAGFLGKALTGVSGLLPDPKVKAKAQASVGVTAPPTTTVAAQAAAFVGSATTSPSTQPESYTQKLVFNDDVTEEVEDVIQKVTGTEPWYKKIPVWGWVAGGVVILLAIFLLIFKTKKR
jgi:hypothetical protein